MSVPTVSVIIPCHDHGHFLGEALDSIESQTLKDYEVLIVDDGSTEPQTVAVLDGLSREKTRVLKRERGGVTRARNIGLGEARGRYVTFLDSDDRFHPQFFERTVAALEPDPALAFAVPWVRLFGDESWEWKPEFCDFPWLLHDCSIPTASLVRRSVASEVGGFDESMELGHEDWNSWIGIVERGYRGVIVPEVLFFYRRAGESRSTVTDRGATHLELYRDLVRRHEASYRRHAFELLWLKESAIEPHLAHLPRLERDVERVLAPRVLALRDAVERGVEV